MEEISTILSSFVKDDKKVLTEFESKNILKMLDLPITEQILVKDTHNFKNILNACESVGFPVVMKLMATDIIHKSDQGAVKLDIKNANEAEMAYNELMKIPSNDSNKSISIQEMAKKPVAEIIIGSNVDPQFGSTIMFGIGGILVEIIKDVSFRIAPLNDFDADEMIHEIKGFKILNGYRGKKPADINAIKNLLKVLSEFVYNIKIIKEMDLNPIFVYDNGIKIVDARIILNSN